MSQHRDQPATAAKAATLEVAEVLAMVEQLPGVVVLTVAEGSTAPESAWGDTFAFYDPDGALPQDRRLPFATVVASDYQGFDTASRLDRPGVFRVNVAAGRARFEEVIGYPPAAHAEHQAEHDYAAFDVFLPHPVYAAQGWVSVLCPTAATTDRLLALLLHAHEQAAERYRGR